MKNNTPFNPVPIPHNLNLALPAAVGQDPASPHHSAPGHSPKRMARAKATQSNRPPHISGRAHREARWHRIKGRPNARLQHLDKDKLKMLLLAGGLAIGIVTAIIDAGGELESYLRVLCGNNRDALFSHLNNKRQLTRKEKKRPTDWMTFFGPFSNNSNQKSIGTGYRPAFASLSANTRL